MVLFSIRTIVSLFSLLWPVVSGVDLAPSRKEDETWNFGSTTMQNYSDVDESIFLFFFARSPPSLMYLCEVWYDGGSTLPRYSSMQGTHHKTENNTLVATNPPPDYLVQRTNDESTNNNGPRPLPPGRPSSPRPTPPLPPPPPPPPSSPPFGR